MRILVLQSGSREHFLSAARAVAVRYPGAALVGLVRDEDHASIAATGLLADLHPLPVDLRRTRTLSVWAPPIDACVVPFEYRLGVQYWTFRLIPLRHRIPRVFSFNRLGRLTQWSWVGWLINTFFVSFLVRPFHHVAIRTWLWLRARADVAGLFALAGLALGYRLLNGIGVNPTGRCHQAKTPGPQRLVLFIPSLGVGGAQRQLVSFLRHVDRTKWEPELVTLEMPDKFFEPMVRALDVPIRYLNPRGDFCMSGIVRRLTDHLRRHPCAVLHSWLHYAAALGAIAGNLAGVPMIVGSLRSERPSRFPWFYPRWRRAIDILTTPLQTRIIANSSAVREENRRWAFIPRKKLVTVYNGIDLGLLEIPARDLLAQLKRELGLPAPAPVVGIVGRLFPEKDHATFLQAARLISDRRPDAHFLIIGEGTLQESVQMEIKRLGLDGQVHVLGNRKDVLALIRLMDVYVLTSVSEGFPNVLLEAGAIGTAIVTTAAGGAVEIVVDGETGYVVPVGDATAVAQRVTELLNDPGLRRRFGEAMGERTRSLFSAGRMASAIEGVYTETNARTRLRICLLSPYAYGRMNPASGWPVGGAELQMTTLAGSLACDPSLEVSMVTTDGDRRARERWGAVTVYLTPLWGRAQVQGATGARKDSGTETTHDLAEAAAPGWLVGVRAVLDALPTWVGLAIRLPLRAGYTIRDDMRVRYWRTRQWLKDRRYELGMAVHWIGVLARVNADIYVTRCASPQLAYAALATRLLRRKLIHMVAHHIDVSGVYAESQGSWGRRYEWGLGRADVIVCQHPQQAMLLRETYGREGVVIRSASLSPVRQETAQNGTYILWIARLDGWKQPDLFLDLVSRMPDRQFVMVGPPSEMDPINHAALRTRIEALPNLRWHGGVPFPETTALFDDALVFVNTSRAEGFPNTFLQAASRGVPVISWTVNPDQVLDRYKFGLCAGADWTRFEDQVRRVCTDVELRARLGENGRRYVAQHHDPTRIAAEYADLFVSLVRKKVEVKAEAKVEAQANAEIC